MKNRFFVAVLMLLAVCRFAAAQGKGKGATRAEIFERQVVEDVRKRYAEMKRMISLMGEGPDWQERAIDADSPGGWPPEYFHVKVVQNLPATGYHEENVKMFYEEVHGEGVDEIYPPLRLAFASSKYNFAAREYYEEFLYDTEGNLIFIYAQEPDLDEGVIVKYRFYIRDSKVIWTTVKESSFDDDGGETEVYADSDLTRDYREALDRYADYSNRIKALFTAVDNARRL